MPVRFGPVQIALVIRFVGSQIGGWELMTTASGMTPRNAERALSQWLDEQLGEGSSDQARASGVTRPWGQTRIYRSDALDYRDSDEHGLRVTYDWGVEQGEQLERDLVQMDEDLHELSRRAAATKSAGGGRPAR